MPRGQTDAADSYPLERFADLGHCLNDRSQKYVHICCSKIDVVTVILIPVFSV